MSTTTFIEATSADPFVRDLHRQAVRLLNDPSLDRKQREFHVRRLQSILIEHQAKQEAKAASLLAKKVSRAQASRENRNQGVADPSQVVARRKEFREAAKERQQGVEGADLKATSLFLATPEPAAKACPACERRRPVLTLKRA
jgi:hypothetical protein